MNEKLVNGLTKAKWKRLNDEICTKIKNTYDLKNIEGVWKIYHEAFFENKAVNDYILENYSEYSEPLSIDNIERILGTARKISGMVQRWDKTSHIADFDSRLLSIYNLFISKKDIKRLSSDMYHDEDTLKTFKGYYYSYIKNSLSEKPFTFKISKKNKKNADLLLTRNHEYLITQKGFHDEGSNETEFLGSGYRSGNTLYATLQSNSKVKDVLPESNIFMILSIPSNWERVAEIRGVLTSISKSEITSPLLSMEVILLSSLISEKTLEIVLSFLSLHRYSYRHRISKDSLKNLTVHNSSYNVRSLLELKGDYQVYRFTNEWSIVRSQLIIDTNLQIKCKRKELVSKKLICEHCTLKIERTDKNNYLLVIKSYKNQRKRYVSSIIQLNWFPINEFQEFKNLTGVISIFYEKKKFQSPIILYKKTEELKEPNHINYKTFIEDIGDDEIKRIKKHLKKVLIPNKIIDNYLSRKD